MELLEAAVKDHLDQGPGLAHGSGTTGGGAGSAPDAEGGGASPSCQGNAGGSMVHLFNVYSYAGGGGGGASVVLVLMAAVTAFCRFWL